MDSLADDGSKALRKYRLIPLIAPIAALAIYVVFILFYDLPALPKIMGGVLTFFVMETTYFNLKHLILPDVDFGVIKCLKPYNLAVLIYALICMAEMVSISRANEALIAVLGILTGLILPVIVILVERGIKKWTT